MLNLNGKSILITGGTGSFGKMFTKLILERNPDIKRLVILSRDEQKHFNMAMDFNETNYPGMRYFIGDVRDKQRLIRAFEGIDIVIAEIGQISNLDHNNQTIVLDHDFDNPVIFANPLSYNGPAPSIARITDIQSDRFSVELQEPSNEDGTHAEETFSFLALEKGVWTLSDGTVIEVGTIDTNAIAGSYWENITFDYDFTNAPIVLTQVQTDNDASFVKTRQNNITQDGFDLALD